MVFSATLKLMPVLASWAVIVMGLSRCFPMRRGVVAGSAAGFACGVAGGAILFYSLRGDMPFSVIKSVVGFSLLTLLIISAFSLYRSIGPGADLLHKPAIRSIALMTGTAILTGTLSGAVCVSRVVVYGNTPALTSLFLLGLSGVLLSAVAVHAERLIPELITVTLEVLLLLTVSALLFASSYSLQLDLFAPLTMKVMKFIHDFVHQFFESMLLPDHLFARPAVWDYIGYLFSSGVGFWGGLVIWIAPPVIQMLTIRLGRLPSVAHIRQGAKRRKLLASYILGRRCRLVVPLFSLMLLLAAVYNSRFPEVEYWDPKPVTVTPNPSGEILIPKKGEIDLEDGKLHKYLVKLDGREVRFMLLTAPDRRLTVTLDACAICKPEGYGQSEGSVICYYCKTLIPLDTVGKPGGCNPVPVPFTEKPDGISIDISTLSNLWIGTVTTTAGTAGGGK